MDLLLFLFFGFSEYWPQSTSYPADKYFASRLTPVNIYIQKLRENVHEVDMKPKKILFTSLLSEPRESQIQVVILKPAKKKKKEKKRKEKETSRMVKSKPDEPNGPRSGVYDLQKTIILLPKIFTRNFALRRHYHQIHKPSVYFWRAAWTVSMILSTTLGSESCKEDFVSYCSECTIASIILMRGR